VSLTFRFFRPRCFTGRGAKYPICFVHCAVCIFSFLGSSGLSSFLSYLISFLCNSVSFVFLFSNIQFALICAMYIIILGIFLRSCHILFLCCRFFFFILLRFCFLDLVLHFLSLISDRLLLRHYLTDLHFIISLLLFGIFEFVWLVAAVEFALNAVLHMGYYLTV